MKIEEAEETINLGEFDTEFKAAYIHQVAKHFIKTHRLAASSDILEACRKADSIQVTSETDLIEETIKLYGSIAEDELIESLYIEPNKDRFYADLKVVLSSRSVHRGLDCGKGEIWGGGDEGIIYLTALSKH